MKRLIKWLITGVAGLILFVAIAALIGLGYREWRHRSVEPQYEIATPNGIDEALFVDLNGTRQWVTIRGRDRSNPVILMLHGGGGSSMSSFTGRFLDWERDFVLVQWDQPGAGRTYRAAGREIDPDLTIEQMTDDGNRLAEWLIEYLDADSINLLGWSWGSVLGVYMVKARPDLYAAYIGTGQVLDMVRGEEVAYVNVLAKAEQRGDAQAIEDLTRIGAPPYDAADEIAAHRSWAIEYELGQSALGTLMLPVLFEPRVTLSDIVDSRTARDAWGTHFFGDTLQGPLVDLDLTMLGARFDVPMFVIQGAQDDFTPASLAREFVEFVNAPAKDYFAIEGAGHFAIISKNEQFLQIVRNALTSTQR